MLALLYIHLSFFTFVFPPSNLSLILRGGTICYKDNEPWTSLVPFLVQLPSTCVSLVMVFKILAFYFQSKEDNNYHHLKLSWWFYDVTHIKLQGGGWYSIIVSSLCLPWLLHFPDDGTCRRSAWKSLLTAKEQWGFAQAGNGRFSYPICRSDLIK